MQRPDKTEPERIPAPMEEIHRILRQRILGEEYAPSQKLSENAIAREFGCSRTPVREAFKRLDNEHLIEIRPQSGTYVRATTSQDFVDLLAVRAYLEGLAVRLAITEGTAEDFDGMAQLLEKMEGIVIDGPEAMQRFGELHYQFHFAIVRMSRNKLLVTMFERLNLRASHMFLRSMSPPDARNTSAEHHRILDALRARDPKGEKFMIDHLWRRKLKMARA